MNKFIAMLILGVVAAAMLLVLGMHVRQSADGEPQTPAALSASLDAGAENAGGAPGDSLTEGANIATGLPSAGAEPAGLATPAGETAPGGQPVVIPVQSGQGAAASSQVTGSPGSTTGSTASTGVAGATDRPNRPAGVTPNRRTAAQPGDVRGGDSSRAVPSAPATASVSRGRGSIVELSLQFRGRGMALVIEGNGPLPARRFVLANPNRLVVDLPGSWSNLKAPSVPANNLVKSARLGRQDDADRLVLDLKTTLKSHSINRVSDKKVEVLFN